MTGCKGSIRSTLKWHTFHGPPKDKLGIRNPVLNLLATRFFAFLLSNVDFYPQPVVLKYIWWNVPYNEVSCIQPQALQKVEAPQLALRYQLQPPQFHLHNGFVVWLSPLFGQILWKEAMIMTLFGGSWWYLNLPLGHMAPRPWQGSIPSSSAVQEELSWGLL